MTGNPPTRRVGYVLKTLTYVMQRKNIRHLHAHFANIPTFVAELVKRLSGITYSFTAHAKDIYLTNKHTEYNQRYLQDAGGGCTPILLTYHGVDLRSFSTPDAVGPRVALPIILSVGRFREKKGFPYLIQACRRLKESGYRFRCSIVGWGPLRDDLEALIGDLDLDGNGAECKSLRARSGG